MLTVQTQTLVYLNLVRKNDKIDWKIHTFVVSIIKICVHNLYHPYYPDKAMTAVFNELHPLVRVHSVFSSTAKGP